MKKEHKDYTKYKDDYIDLSDFFAGERSIKDKGERYTPKLEGHRKNDGRYERYKEFGILFNALSRTRQGLKGAILRKPVDIQFPESQKEQLDEIVLTGGSFQDLIRSVCDAVLGFGRYGVLVDVDETEKPYVALYNPLSILSWPGSKKDKQKIVLQEFVEQPKKDDPEENEIIEQRRVLEIDDAGHYLVSVYQMSGETEKTWTLVEEPKTPQYKGKRLNHIPFVFFGSSSNVPPPSKPPLLDLLNLSKGHWKLTVAYQYGLHFAGLPTPCFAGFDFEEGADIPLGPGAAYHGEAGANSWFLQTGGSGLTDIERGLDRLEAQMAIAGARLLESQRPGVEAAETVRLRSSGDSATLADIAGNVENGLTKVLQHIGFWLGISPKECHVSVNKDFVSTRLAPQDITALLAAVQSGKMSEETFIWNLKQGEVLPQGQSIEDEQEAIAEDTARNQKNSKNLQGLAGKFL